MKSVKRSDVSGNAIGTVWRCTLGSSSDSIVIVLPADSPCVRLLWLCGSYENFVSFPVPWDQMAMSGPYTSWRRVL